MRSLTLLLLCLAGGPFLRQDPEEAACRAALAYERTELNSERAAHIAANVRETALRNELQNMEIQRNLALRERDATAEAVKTKARCVAKVLGVPVSCKIVYDGQ